VSNFGDAVGDVLGIGSLDAGRLSGTGGPGPVDVGCGPFGLAGSGGPSEVACGYGGKGPRRDGVVVGACHSSGTGGLAADDIRGSEQFGLTGACGSPEFTGGDGEN
jgi:hypothetical protein